MEKELRRINMKHTNYLAGLAAITMTFTGMAAPISVYADTVSVSTNSEYAQYGDFTYLIGENKTAYIVEYDGKDENVVIPSEINGLTVTAIMSWAGPQISGNHPTGAKKGAFAYNETIKSVVIPDTVKVIDSESFINCSSLESVTIGNSVEKINSYAFFGCEKLTKVYLPVSVNEIGSEAFGYIIDPETRMDTLSKNFTITCAQSSEAEGYAKENGISFDTYQIKIDDFVVSGIENKEYTGKPVTQKITVKNGNDVLAEGTDFTVAYESNTKVGTAIVTITGAGSYTGEIKTNFVIDPAKQEIQKLESRFGGFYIDYVQKGSATGYEIQYSTDSKLSNAKTVKVANNKTDKTTVSKLSTGKKYYVRVRSFTTVGGKTYNGKWSDVKSVATAKYDISKTAVSGISTKTYTGKNITQSIVLKYNGKTLKSGADYTVSYVNNKKVGTATIKITGKGQYGGVISKTFKINPAKQEIQKLTAKSKAFYIDWAQKGSATGYEVQYAANSKLNGAKKITVTNNKTDKKTVSKLSANKKYYVRVRSYTVVKGTKYYGMWSAVKSVTTKK